ncbi:hypothetical protein Tco_0594302 [Tanacetum coccineum]
MESSSSNLEEKELQQMQQEERKLHSKCMERFKILMSHLSFGDTQLNYGFTLAFKRYFGEVHETFCQKMFQNVNELQWKLEKYNLHECDPKNCLVVLRTQFKKFFDSKEVNASDFEYKSSQQSFKNSTGTDPQTFKERLHEYLDGLDKVIDERLIQYGELQMKEREVKAIKEIEKRLNESKMQTQESLVIEGATLEASLVTEGVALEESLVTKGNENISYDNESSSLGNDVDVEKILVGTVASDIKIADISPSYDSDTVPKVHHDTFQIVFANEIQNRYKEEHDYVDYEQKHAFFASLINNLKCDVEKCNMVNREAQQANALLTNKIERYKEKEKHFENDKIIESEYCKKIKLLNDKISNLKSQACQNDKTFARENGKYDGYVQPLLKRKK